MKSVIKQILAIGLLLSTSSSEGTDWGRFRGPNGSGVATAGKIPVDYVKTDAVWETTVDGKGNSSPIIAGGDV